MNMKQWLKDFVHNCVVHPAMPFLPVKVANWLHDKNANWAFGLERYDELALEGKKKPTIRKLAQALVDDAMDGGPLHQWLIKPMDFSSVVVPQESLLTGERLLHLIDEELKKNQKEQVAQDFLKDSGLDEEPML